MNVPIEGMSYKVPYVIPGRLVRCSVTSPPEDLSVDGYGPEKADELLGTIFVGRYELSSILGSGGMGVIYLGRQIFLDKPVAVKVLKGVDISQKARMRFHQEAKAASSLSHPGIVSIIDFGVDEADRPYMVMEFVEGCSLGELLAERLILSLEDCMPIFLETCDALDAAHKKGIVHRDIKPSNIMLVVDDDAVHVKLLDFGVAKLLDFSEHTLQDLTKTGDTLGTPLYMSPEQINSKSVTYTSDLYSLGCTMYACLTGAPPFIGETKMQTMEMHCDDVPMSLSEASEGLQFPPELEAIIMRLLAKNPADRFENAKQVKQALLDMLAAVESRQKSASTYPLFSVTNWTDESKGMSESVSQSVHNSLAGRARLAPTRETVKQKPSQNMEKSSDSESVFWESDLSGRIAQAKGHQGQGVLSKHFLADGSGSIRSKFVRRTNKSLLIALLCSIACVATFVIVQIQHSNFLVKAKPVPVILPSSAAASEKRSVPSTSKAPDADVTSADTVIESTIQSNPTANSLNLKGIYGLTSKGLSKLRLLKSLTALDLSDTGLTDEDAKILSGLNLRVLALDGNDELSNWSLLAVSSINSLKTLSLDRTNITDDGLRHLNRCRNLRVLNLSHNPRITSKGIRNLNPESSPIEALSAIDCALNDSMAEDLLKFKKLKVVCLDGNLTITDQFMDVLARQPMKFVVLTVGNSAITSRGVQSLGKFHSLRTLGLARISLNAKNLDLLVKMQQLEQLYVPYCPVTPDQLQRLKTALPKTQIVTDAIMYVTR